jgi:hypothetical protein
MDVIGRAQSFPKRQRLYRVRTGAGRRKGQEKKRNYRDIVGRLSLAAAGTIHEHRQHGPIVACRGMWEEDLKL